MINRFKDYSGDKVCYASLGDAEDFKYYGITSEVLTSIFPKLNSLWIKDPQHNFHSLSGPLLVEEKLTVSCRAMHFSNGFSLHENLRTRQDKTWPINPAKLVIEGKLKRVCKHVNLTLRGNRHLTTFQRLVIIPLVQNSPWENMNVMFNGTLHVVPRRSQHQACGLLSSQ